MDWHWQVPKMWEDAEVWVMGGGPSMPRQFGIPENVIYNVESKQEPITVYSDFLHPIHNSHVIGANIAFLLGPWISVLYFCDGQFWKTYQEQINNFHNLKVTDANRKLTGEGVENIKRLRRDNSMGLSRRPDMIRWNFNTGAAAINFAILAGAKRILLLGFDMKATDKRTHWHEGFRTYERPTVPHSFKRWLRKFKAIEQDAKRMKVEILNICPDSAIRDFKKVELKEVL